MKKESDQTESFWADFIYSHLIDDIRRKIENTYHNQDGLTDAYTYLHEIDPNHRKSPPAKKTESNLLKKIRETKSSINTAIKSAKSLAKSFTKFSSYDEFLKFASGFMNQDGKVSLRYGEFNSFEKAIDERLDELLPNIDPEDNSNWPGALSLQQTLSLFTHLCLRVHSEMPEENHHEVLKTSIKMVVIPALSFAIYQAGMGGEAHPYAVKCLEAIASGKEQFPKPNSFENTGTKKRDKQSKHRHAAMRCIEEHAWQRLLETLQNMGNKLSETYVKECALECLRLIKDHESHPHGSDLWKSLSRLSSTTPGANDLLVFEALNRMGYSKPNQVMKARLHCSRTRYEAIAAGYYDSTFREMLSQDVSTLVKYVSEMSPKWKTSEKLSKAFLLSRRCLIPSDSLPDDRLENQTTMSALVDSLLNSCLTGNSDSKVDLLVNRYFAGFLTNPRFIKPSRHNLNSIEEAVKHYEKLAKNSSNTTDIAIVDQFKGRLAWFRMLNGNPSLSKEVFKHYGVALKTLFEYENRKVIIDSEVPVWLLPEVITLISLGENLTFSDLYRKSLIKDEDIKPPVENINFAKVMQKVGERHYGIYFNMHAELRRICLGVLRASKIGK